MNHALTRKEIKSFIRILTKYVQCVINFNTCLNIYRTWNKTTLWIPYLTLRKNRQNNGTVFEKKESYTISSWSKVVRKLSAKKFKDVICGQTSQIMCTMICSIRTLNNHLFCTILVFFTILLKLHIIVHIEYLMLNIL